MKRVALTRRLTRKFPPQRPDILVSWTDGFNPPEYIAHLHYDKRGELTPGPPGCPECALVQKQQAQLRDSSKANDTR